MKFSLFTTLGAFLFIFITPVSSYYVATGGQPGLLKSKTAKAMGMGSINLGLGSKYNYSSKGVM